MRNIIIINEQHNLLPQQSELIRKKLGTEIELKKIPTEGLNRDQIEELAEDLNNLHDVNIIILSPIPLLLARLAERIGERKGMELVDVPGSIGSRLWIFHNDKREKKEINGVIRSVIASDGWELIEI